MVTLIASLSIFLSKSLLIEKPLLGKSKAAFPIGVS
jgi:hypothetical protein